LILKSSGWLAKESKIKKRVNGSENSVSTVKPTNEAHEHQMDQPHHQSMIYYFAMTVT
jgi:hypothetical protein